MTAQVGLRIQATGEIRDKDGNLIETVTVDQVVAITDDTMAALAAHLTEGDEQP